MENQRPVLIPRKYKLSDKWKTPWCIHKNVLHINYFISCHRKKMQHTIEGWVYPVFWLAVFSIYFLYVCNTYLRSKWQSFLFSSRDSSQSSWYSYVCVSALCQAKLWKKNEWQWSPYSLDSIWFRRDRFGWQFYFRLPNWHYPSSPRRGLLYIPPRNKSKNFLPLPFHSTCRNPIMFVGEERERKRGKRDTLRLRRRAQKCNLSTTVKL